MTFIKNWFSNMLPFDKPMVYQRLEYYTVENFYQAMKLPKGNIDKRDYIASLDAYGAKREGRKLQIRPDWEAIKIDVMEYALRFKFQKGTSWHSQLMATDGEIFEFNNWNDKFWGVAVDDTIIWHWFSTTYACGAIITDMDNIIINSAPIYKWTRGQPINKVISFLKRKGQFKEHKPLGEGQNHLGKLLMKLREEFRK